MTVRVCKPIGRIGGGQVSPHPERRIVIALDRRRRASTSAYESKPRHAEGFFEVTGA